MILAVLLLCAILVASSNAGIVDVALAAVKTNPELSTFASLLETHRAALAARMSPAPEWTVFAPDNAAFKIARNLDTSNADVAVDLLLYHFVAARVVNTTYDSYQVAATMLGGENARSLRGVRSQQMLVLGRQTRAIAVVACGINSARVLGVVEINGQATMNLVDAAGNGTIFAGLVERAGLVDELNAKQDLTIFAPMDVAFEHTTATQRAAIPRSQLRRFAMAHVVQGVKYSFDIESKVRAETTHVEADAGGAGGELTFKIDADGDLAINEAQEPGYILMSDILMRNGVTHFVTGLLTKLVDG